MNTIQTITAIINSIGLIFDIIGAILVASEVVRQYKGNQYKENPTWIEMAKQAKSEDYIKHKKQNYKLMSYGLRFLILGFLFQIASQWSPIFFSILSSFRSEIQEIQGHIPYFL